MPTPQDLQTPPVDPSPAQTPAPETPEPSPPGHNQPTPQTPAASNLQAQLDAARARETALQQQLAQAQQREDEARQAEMTELERERERATNLETQLSALRAQEEQRDKADRVWLTAREMGVLPARREALLRLVDLSDVTLVAGGDVQGVEAVLEQARTLAPEFFAGNVTTTTPTQSGERPSERTPNAPLDDEAKGAAHMKALKSGAKTGRSGRTRRL